MHTTKMMEDGEELLGNKSKDNIDGGKRPGIGSIIGMLLGASLLISPIVIGGLYKDDCPAEPMIPIWCLVHGSLALISSVLEFLLQLRVIFGANETGKHALLIRLIHMFLPIWAIVGGVYTYRNYETISYNLCDKTLYMFSFWYLNVIFTVMCLVVFCTSCCCCLKNMPKIGPDPPNELQPMVKTQHYLFDQSSTEGCQEFEK